MSDVENKIHIQQVTTENWRDVSKLTINTSQEDFVATSTYYIALCCYSDWNPLAIYLNDIVIGFLMWGIDDDKSCWLGGILIDQNRQNKGYGRKAVNAAISYLKEEISATEFALSYQAENVVARHLYQSIGFIETGEMEDDEIVARLKF